MTIIDLIKIVGVEIYRRLANLQPNDALISGTNASGDQVIKIDQIADQLMFRALSKSSEIEAIASEERDQLWVRSEQVSDSCSTTYFSANSKLMVAYDPLDGSQNIGLNLPLGTIFAIFKYDSSAFKPADLLVSGYLLYGQKLELVFANQHTVERHWWSPFTKQWSYYGPLKVPTQGKYYAWNQSRSASWNPKINTFLQSEIESGKSLRWEGCLVADIHRILICGGSYGYPTLTKYPQGRLRWLYEVLPINHLFETAGGHLVAEHKVKSEIPWDQLDLHQRRSIILLGPDCAQFQLITESED